MPNELIVYRPNGLTRWQRLKESLRSISLGPYDTKDKTLARLFGAKPSLSGVSVTEDSALQISAVWSAVTMIADDIASLPLILYKRKDGGKERYEDHPLYRLLHDAPNPEMDSMVFRRTVQTHALIWQNGYAEIERDGAGRPVALWPIVPESVSVVRERGRLLYRVKNPSGSEVFLPPDDMLHLVGHSHDGSVGSSMVMYARESLGLTLAAEQFGSAFFGNGATVQGVVSVKMAKPADPVVQNHQAQLEARHQGVQRAHKWLVLYNDASFTPITVEPNKGQFNETRIHQIREVARWFKMPPHKLGDLADATYSNVEQMDAAYLSSCIRPWLVLWQQQLNRKLIRSLEYRQQFIEHETHGFLSVDAASRAELYGSEFNIGAIQINEVRKYENRNPVTGGDRSFVPLNMIPLDKVDAWWDAEIEVKKRPPEPPQPQQKPDAEEKDRQIRELTEQRELARKLAQSHEDAKDLATARYEATLATLQTVTAERDAARSELATSNEALEQATRARREADARREAAEALAAQMQQQRDAEIARTLEAETDRDHWKATADRAYGQIATLTAERAASETLKTDLARARADLATELDKQKTQRGVMLAAMRSLFADATERLLQREIDRARKHQATAEKLRAWMTQFYPVHTDVVRQAFRPLVGPWTAVTGGAPSDLLERLVCEHIQTSALQLQQILSHEDDDDRAAALERTFRRWEDERGDAVADALLREGMAS